MGASTRDYMREPTRGYRGPRRVTWVALVAIVLCWILWSFSLAPSSSHDLARLFSERLLLSPADVLAGKGWWQPLSAPWFHDPRGLLHLLVATMLLVAVGLRVEEEVGARRYVLVAGACSLAGSAAAIALHALGGASAVTFGALPVGLGLLFFSAVRHPEARVFGVPGVVAGVVGVLLYEALRWNLLGGGLPFLVSDVAGGATGAALALVRRRAPSAEPSQPRVPAEPSPRTQVDALLDRIRDQGMDSLTAEEKEFLRRASAGYRGSST